MQVIARDEALVRLVIGPEVRSLVQLRERRVERLDLRVECRAAALDVRRPRPRDGRDDRDLARAEDGLDHRDVVVVEGRRVAAAVCVVGAERDPDVSPRERVQPGTDVRGAVEGTDAAGAAVLVGRVEPRPRGAHELAVVAGAVDRLVVQGVHRDRVAEEDRAVAYTQARIVDVEVEYRVRVPRRPIGRGDADPYPVVAGEIDEMLTGVIAVARHCHERHPRGCWRGPTARGRVGLDGVVPGDVVGEVSDDAVVVRRGLRVVVPGDDDLTALGHRHAREVVRERRGDRSVPVAGVIAVVRVARGVDLRRCEGGNASTDQRHRRRATRASGAAQRHTMRTAAGVVADRHACGSRSCRAGGELHGDLARPACRDRARRERTRVGLRVVPGIRGSGCVVVDGHLTSLP